VAILEEYIEVTLQPQTIKYYEARGYSIPRSADAQGRIRTPQGTVMRVRVIDLPLLSKVRLTKVCDNCGKIVTGQKYSDITQGRAGGKDLCRTCSISDTNKKVPLQKIQDGHNLANTNSAVTKLWHPTLNGKLTPSGVSPMSRFRAWWLCNEGRCTHTWKARVFHVARGTRCPACKMSKGERRIREYVQFLGYEYRAQESMDGLLGTGGGSLLYDFVVMYPNGEYALIIEFDGIGHVEPTDFSGKGEVHAVSEFKRIQIHDKRKDDWASTNNVPILRIGHTEYDDIERKINEALGDVISKQAAVDRFAEWDGNITEVSE